MAIDTLLSLDLNPLALFGLSIFICSSIIGFTSRTSILRPAGLLAEACCVFLAISSVRKTPFDPNFYNTLLVCHLGVVFLAYLDGALLSNWTFEAQGPTSSRGGHTVLRTAKDERKPIHKTIFKRFKFGVEQCFRTRSPGSPWQINNIPPFFPDRPKVVPTRSQFMFSTTKKLLVNILIIDALSFNGRSGNKTDYDPAYIPLFSRLGDVTFEELKTRAANAVLFWIFGSFILQAVCDCSAFLTIGLGLGNIAHWPPLWGHYTQLWSVRQFWGCYWHQELRQKLSAAANFISFSILRLKRGTIVARYTLIILTFFVSGLLHQFGDFSLGMSWSESGAIRFFVMQAVGIMIEDAAQGIFRWVHGEPRTAEPAKGWRAGVGYVWLLAWLTWTTPGWSYPGAVHGSGGILPFSLLKTFIK